MIIIAYGQFQMPKRNAHTHTSELAAYSPLLENADLTNKQAQSKMLK